MTAPLDPTAEPSAAQQEAEGNLFLAAMGSMPTGAG